MARTTRLPRKVQTMLEHEVAAAWMRLGVDARAKDVELELRQVQPKLVERYEAECPIEASRLRFYLRRRPGGLSNTGTWLPNDEADIQRRIERILGLTPAVMRRIVSRSAVPANRPDEPPNEGLA